MFFKNYEYTGFRLNMAGGAGWSITKKGFENVEYTHKWHIESFDFAMEIEKGKIESSSFCIPGVPGEFKMMVLKKEFKFGSGRSWCYKMPEKIMVDGKELEIKHLFSVFLMSTEKDTRAAAKLEVIQEGKDTFCGKFGDSSAHKFLHFSSLQHSVYQDSDFKLLFEPEVAFKWLHAGVSKDGAGFYTTGSTNLLTLVARITIASKLTSLGGTEEEGMGLGRLLDFTPLLSNSKHSDIVLNCGGSRFLCHKAVLALR